jgi:hypothetical protein
MDVDFGVEEPEGEVHATETPASEAAVAMHLGDQTGEERERLDAVRTNDSAEREVRRTGLQGYQMGWIGWCGWSLGKGP